MNSHVGTELRAVVYVAGLAEGGVGAAHVMMVSAQHHRGTQLTTTDGIVEGQCYACSALGIGIQYAGLGTYYQLVLACLAYPVQVVGQLTAYALWRALNHVGKYFGGQAVGHRQVLWLA